MAYGTFRRNRLHSAARTNSGLRRFRRNRLHSAARTKIQAKAQAVDNVISHAEIKDNPKSLTRAVVAWTKVEVLRCEYEAIMDEAYEAMG